MSMAVVTSALAGGFIGTMVLTTVARGAGELGWTRMDLAFLLGTMVTDRRRRAKAIGYGMLFAFGVAFALVYALCFVAVGRSGWLLGALFGALHALFVSTVVVNVLLPAVHPRIGTPETAANQVALIEPPGFLMLNYGRSTFLITLVAHIVYGIIVGLSVRV
jgi:hypothetical protein